MASRTDRTGTGFGLIADIAIGVVGALIGSWLLPHLGHSPWIWNCSGDHWSYHRRHSLAFDSQAGLSSRSLVIKSEGKVWVSLELSALSVVIGLVMR